MFWKFDYDGTIAGIVDVHLLAIWFRHNCRISDKMEISVDRNIWAGQDITSSEDPISMPTFEFVFGSSSIAVVR